MTLTLSRWIRGSLCLSNFIKNISSQQLKNCYLRSLALLFSFEFDQNFLIPTVRRLIFEIKNYLKGPVFLISSNGGVIVFSADETFSIKNGVIRIHSDLVFCGISDQTLRVSKANIRGSSSVTLKKI